MRSKVASTFLNDLKQNESKVNDLLLNSINGLGSNTKDVDDQIADTLNFLNHFESKKNKFDDVLTNAGKAAITDAKIRLKGTQKFVQGLDKLSLAAYSAERDLPLDEKTSDLMSAVLNGNLSLSDIAERFDVDKGETSKVIHIKKLFDAAFGNSPTKRYARESNT